MSFSKSMDGHRGRTGAHTGPLAGGLTILRRGFAAEKKLPLLEVRRLAPRGEFLLQPRHGLVQDCGCPKLIECPLRHGLGSRFPREAFFARFRFFQRHDYPTAAPLERLTASPLIG